MQDDRQIACEDADKTHGEAIVAALDAYIDCRINHGEKSALVNQLRRELAYQIDTTIKQLVAE